MDQLGLDLIFKRFQHLLSYLKKEEGIQIVPILRKNEFYKPGYHGRERVRYDENFLCLMLLGEFPAICYLGTARFGPGSQAVQFAGATEDADPKKITLLTTEEFKKALNRIDLFYPFDNADGRNSIFFAIRNLCNIVQHNKLAKIYNEG